MRPRLLLLVVGIGIVPALPTNVALGIERAVHPEASTTYTGSGSLCENYTHSSTFSCRGESDVFSFRTTATGTKLARLQGKVGPLYCSGSSASFSVGSIAVRSNGSFAFSGGAAAVKPTKAGMWVAETPRTPGQRVFVNEILVRGDFTGPRTVHVSYQILVDVSKPPTNKQCRAEVTGTAHAR